MDKEMFGPSPGFSPRTPPGLPEPTPADRAARRLTLRHQGSPVIPAEDRAPQPGGDVHMGSLRRQAKVDSVPGTGGGPSLGNRRGLRDAARPTQRPRDDRLKVGRAHQSRVPTSLSSSKEAGSLNLLGEMSMEANR